MSKGRKPPDRSDAIALVAERLPPSDAHANPCIGVAQQAEREMAISLLSPERGPGQVRQVAQHAEWLARNLAEQLADSRDVACRAGCAWCCSLFVSATAPEILQIAEYLRASYSAGDLAALRDRLARREQQFAGKTAEQRSAARLPCVLLADGRCSVYAVRPLACGSWTSTDAGRCEASWRQRWASAITANQMQLWLYGGVMLGLREALDTCGLASEQLDLASALRIALDTPDAAERWLAGEPIFAPAQVDLLPRNE